MQKPISLEQT